MNRFEFLKSDYENIYKLCTEAQENKNMNKARQVIEAIVRQFGATKRHLFDRIAEVSERAKMPKDIVAAFHQVRLVGNKASHDETLAWNKMTESDIEKCLNSLFEIVVWLVFGHDKKEYALNDFNFSIEDLKIIDKYLSDEVKSKRDKFKELGTFINSLEVSKEVLDFDNAVEDEFEQDVFETMDEYVDRIVKMPLQHIGYAILDNRTRDNYTSLTFAMYHIEKNERINFAEITALFANKDTIADDFVDGKILVGLKVRDGKIYCDYDKIYLQGPDGNNIQLTAICWNKYGYEDDKSFKHRLKSLPILPLGFAKPVRKEYDIHTQYLPFKVALYKYTKPILIFDEVFGKFNRSIAKQFCDFKEYFKLYGKMDEILYSTEYKITLRHAQYDKDIKCKNIIGGKLKAAKIKQQEQTEKEEKKLETTIEVETDFGYIFSFKK